MPPKPHLVAGSDHAGFELKRELVQRLRVAGYTVDDLGAHGPEPCDYPDVAGQVGRAVAIAPGRLGLLVCGSGVGMSIAANKIAGVRAAHAQDTLTAELARRHNDANVLCLGARILGVSLAWHMLEAFLAARFEGERHQARVDKIAALERPGR